MGGAGEAQAFGAKVGGIDGVFDDFAIAAAQAFGGESVRVVEAIEGFVLAQCAFSCCQIVFALCFAAFGNVVQAHEHPAAVEHCRDVGDVVHVAAVCAVGKIGHGVVNGVGGALVFRLREAFFEDAVQGGKRGVCFGGCRQGAGKQVLHQGAGSIELVAANDKVCHQRFEAELVGMRGDVVEQLGGGLVHGKDNGQALLFDVSGDVGAKRLGLVFRFGQLGDEVDGVLTEDDVEFVGLVGAHIGGHGLDDVPADFGVVGAAK